MTLTLQVIIACVGMVLSVGVTYGVVKTKIKFLEDKVKELGDCDKIIRGYLFGSDAMPVYVPVGSCDKLHDKLTIQYNELNNKLDKVIDLIIKKGQ